MKRFAGIVAIVLGISILGFALFVAMRQNLRFQAPYPTIAASTDSAVVERGRYVVRELANCTVCHGDPAKHEALAAGEEVPLSGGFEWAIPPGHFYARNITPDPETGIGRFSDGDIARALRYGVGRDGRALLPFMEMQGLSDQDLTAVVSYLRTQPPVRNAVPAHRPSLLGRIVLATVLASPVGPKEPPAQVSPSGANIENGRYLTEAVANCWACHTQRNMATGALSGPRFGGATGFMDERNPKRSWSPPNLTSDPETGRLALYTEDEFVARMRVGRVIEGSPMPWQAYRRMPEDDLRAIYRYLKTMPPTRNDVGPPFVDKP